MHTQPYNKNNDGIRLANNRTTSSAVQACPLIYWVNLMKDCCPSTLARQVEQFLEVQVYTGVNVINSNKSGNSPDFICFEYDYPDCYSLNYLKETRNEYPDVPIIMFTLQHSEELAVWALRNRIWDYYFKPIDANSLRDLVREMTRCYNKSISKKKSESNGFINNRYPIEVRFNNVSQSKKTADIALNYIEENYGKKIYENDVAALCDLSRFQFTRLFKKAVGSTFQTYLLEFRMKKAKILLQIPSARVVDVAFSVGFTDPAYFTRAFKRSVGTPPSSFQLPH